jgi:hypothetical protein
MEYDNRVASKETAVVEFSLLKVMEFFSLPDFTKKINEELLRFDVLHNDEEDQFRVIHMEHKGVWPVSNRDFVIVSVRRQVGDNSFYIASKSCSYPLPEVKDVVRA